MTIVAIEVSYWAVDGERWCNVNGIITAALAAEWESNGWQIVTRVTEIEMPVYGELE